MMHNGKCRCPHHWVMKLLILLAWVSGVLFFWASWASRTFWGFDASYWAWTVVVLVLLTKTGKGCRCCCGGMHCNMCPTDKKQM